MEDTLSFKNSHDRFKYGLTMQMWCRELLRCAQRLRYWSSSDTELVSSTAAKKTGNCSEPRAAGCCAWNSVSPTFISRSNKSGSILPDTSKEVIGPIKDPRDAWCTLDVDRGALNVTYKACSSASGHSTSKCSEFSGTSCRHLPIHVVLGAVNATSSPFRKKPSRPSWKQNICTLSSIFSNFKQIQGYVVLFEANEQAISNFVTRQVWETNQNRLPHRLDSVCFDALRASHSLGTHFIVWHRQKF